MYRFFETIEQIRAETFFLITGIVFGFSTLLITPPFQAPDEHNHFARSYQVSEANFVSTKQTFSPDDRISPYEYVNSIAFRQDNLIASGGMLPTSLAYAFETASKGVEFYSDNKHSLNKTLSLLNQPLNSEQRTFFHFANTAVYSAVPYIPQSVGITTGRLFNLSPLLLMYLGRITNLCAWLCSIYFALKLIPTIKHPMLLLALMPMTLFQASSLSADACINSFSFLLIALSLKYSYQYEKPNISDYCLLLCISLVITLSKMAYLPLIGMLLIVPRNKTAPLKAHYLAITAIISICVISALAWTRIADSLYIPYVPYSSSRDQLRVIIENPYFYFKVIAGIWNTPGIDLIYEFIGILGWLDTKFPRWYYALYLLGILSATLSEPRPALEKNRTYYILISFSLVTSFMLVVTAVYLYWTPVGLDKVAVQGRYFIPLSPLIILLISNNATKFKLPFRNSLVYLFSLFSSVLMLFQLVNRYYLM